jgi:hypothetical protein
VSPVVNLYIVEVRVLFAGHRTIEVQSRARLPRNPWSEKWLCMEWGCGRSKSRYKSMSANVNPQVRQPAQLDIFRKMTK